MDERTHEDRFVDGLHASADDFLWNIANEFLYFIFFRIKNGGDHAVVVHGSENWAAKCGEGERGG